MPLVLQLTQLNLQLPAQQIQSVLRARFQDVVHTHKLRTIFVNHTSQWRNTHLTIREGIQRIDRQIRTDTWRQLHLNLNVFGGVINHLFNLNLTVIAGLDNAFYQRTRGGTKRNFLDQQSRLVFLFDF